jgi:protein SCO1/2
MSTRHKPSEVKKMMNSNALLNRSFLPLALLLLSALPPGLARAEDDHAHHRPAPAFKSQALGGLTLPDVTLHDQDGNEVRFVSDLVAGKVVAVNFIFTTCTTVCPPMGATFGKLQELLGATAGGEVEMISVSVDPVVDTPQRLKAWSDRFGRQPGWTLLTGDKPTIDRLLKALQVFTPDKGDHAPIVLVGDARHDNWTRAYGLAPAAQLAEMIEGLLMIKEPPMIKEPLQPSKVSAPQEEGR